MADKKKATAAPAAEPRKKADVILEKIECLLSASNEMVSRVDKSVASTNYISRQNSEIYEKTLEENANIRQQMKYLAAQTQSVFDKMSAMISELSEKVSGLQTAVEKTEAGGAAIDYDVLAEAVVARIDLDEISRGVAEALSDGGEADVTAEKETAETGGETAMFEAEEVIAGEDGEDAYGIDYDLIADKVAERILRSVTRSGEDGEITMGDVKEEISADYIASRVADQIVIPDPDYDMIADAVFERFYQDDETAETETVEIEEDDGFEDGIVEEDYEPTEDELEEFAADEDALPEYGYIDYEKIAALVVDKLVESDGEDAETEFDFDYEKLADLVAERLFRGEGEGEEIEEEETVEFDYDKLAEAIAVKMSEGEGEAEDTVTLTDDAMAQIVDEISKRVCEALPSDYDIVVDDEGCAAIANAVSEKIIGAEDETAVEETEETEEEFDIFIDEDGVAEISDGVAEKVISAMESRIGETEGKLAAFESAAGERFDKIESDVGEIREILKNGTYIAASEELAAAEAVAGEVEEPEEVTGEPAEEPVEEVTEESVEEPAGEAAAETVETVEAVEAVEPEDDEESEKLVTVSDVIGEEIIGDESAEETENAEGLVEFIEEPETDGIIEEIVSDIDEQPVEGEVMPDGLDGASATVDFANMMKYNRSFIARIIQGSDEVKTYYGQTKTALLSYKKVNSSVAWGAERFNKGRETIAKFKIRGKTLCLYLALDPKEYPVSVYHQVDVSDNKSMATTPMMVKIKSPRGVKKAIRLIDEMLEKRGAVKQTVAERDYVAMYPYETIEELIEDGLVKDVSKNK